MTSARLQLFLVLAAFHLVVFNVFRGLIAREDGVRFVLVDAFGWLDARSPGARRYRTIAILWIVGGFVGAVLVWRVWYP